MIDDRTWRAYQQDLRQVSTLTLEREAAAFGLLDLSAPTLARDALLELVPQIISAFLPVAATVAANWYETSRRQQLGRDFAAVLADPYDEAQIAGTVRWAAGALFTDQPEQTLTALSGATQRYVTNAARQTIGLNVARDPAKPRWARVPSGLHTCAWCTLLASRGFVYHSERSAGAFLHEYHDDCNCQPVADWSDDPGLNGYDPSRLYGLYSEARDDPALGGNDDRSIAAAMRRLHPELYTDGVTAAH